MRRATVDMSVTPIGLGVDTERVTVTARRYGSFSVEVPLSFGANVITVAMTTQDDSTAYERGTVTSDLIQGDTVLAVSDPVGDDYGPGTLAYPSPVTSATGRSTSPVPGRAR